jgi:ribosome biogenesis protein BRX1
MSFFFVDNRVWIRNYQLATVDDAKPGDENQALVEVGPRVVLEPIRIFSSSFYGATIYQNDTFVSPNAVPPPLVCADASAPGEHAEGKGRPLQQPR